MADVFISYKVSAGTSALVKRIAEELEGMGISCWYAPRNTAPGAFVPSILQAIDRCKVFLMILDEGANSSGYVFNETVEAWKRYYREKEPPIIPFKIGAFEAARELSFYLSAFHIVNGGASPETADTSELIRKTAAIFHKAPQPPPDVAPRPTTPAAPPAKQGDCGDNVTYTLDENGVLTISGAGAMRDFSWNDEEKFRETPWRYERETISHIEIQNGVTRIGEGAFQDCAGLASVHISDSVTAIESYAFCGCIALASFHIPNNVTAIGDYAFWGCARLTSVVIPNSVTYIGWRAFWGCAGLASVIIPDSVTWIGEQAFQDCARLKSISIPDSVESIGRWAFAGCRKLKSVSVPLYAKIHSQAFPHWVCVERRA